MSGEWIVSIPVVKLVGLRFRADGDVYEITNFAWHEENGVVNPIPMAMKIDDPLKVEQPMRELWDKLKDSPEAALSRADAIIRWGGEDEHTTAEQ